MFGDVEKAFGDTIDSIISNPYIQLALQAIAFYIVLVWLLTAYWAFRDMQHRTTNPVAPYLAAGLIVAFTPFLFQFAVILYRIVRPRETIAEANERALAEEAILAEIEARPHCANCSRAVEEEWIICPTCRNRLRRVCPNCSRLVELDWTLCAWCGKDFERPEIVAPAYMPGPRPQLEGMPAPQQVEGPPRQAPILAPGMLGPEMSPARER
jgi:RNA polymerase subunit RPABC4/transcription elongation factor Spt4